MTLLTRTYFCPTCDVPFRAYGERVRGRGGKRCPTGHWHSYSDLKKHATNREPKPGDDSPYLPPGPPVRSALAGVGLGERNEQLSLALRWMLDGYDKLQGTVPSGIPRALIDGAFGKTPQLAREILG